MVSNSLSPVRRVVSQTCRQLRVAILIASKTVLKIDLLSSELNKRYLRTLFRHLSISNRTFCLMKVNYCIFIVEFA